MPDNRWPEPRGDEGELFRSFNRELFRRVQADVRTEPEIVADACAFAWSQFLRYQPDRNRSWKGWLTTTAQREAWALVRRERETVDLIYEPPDTRRPDRADPAEYVPLREDLREVLDAVSELPEYDRWLVARRAEGYRYEEIAELAGSSYTRVNRGLTRANDMMRERLAERDEALRPRSARGQRLAELEREPPQWLRSCIGDPPRPSSKRGGEAALLAWRRAALALEDYRREHDPDFVLHEAPTPRDAGAERAWGVAEAAIRRLRALRDPERELER